MAIRRFLCVVLSLSGAVRHRFVYSIRASLLSEKTKNLSLQISLLGQEYDFLRYHPA